MARRNKELLAKKGRMMIIGNDPDETLKDRIGTGRPLHRDKLRLGKKWARRSPSVMRPHTKAGNPLVRTCRDLYGNSLRREAIGKVWGDVKEIEGATKY